MFVAKWMARGLFIVGLAYVIFALLYDMSNTPAVQVRQDYLNVQPNLDQPFLKAQPALPPATDGLRAAGNEANNVRDNVDDVMGDREQVSNGGDQIEEAEIRDVPSEQEVSYILLIYILITRVTRMVQFSTSHFASTFTDNFIKNNEQCDNFTK